MDILKELDETFQLIASIPVSHGNVEVMATAKNKLRAVYAELTKKKEVAQENA